MTEAYTIKTLDSSTWSAFARLAEENNGVFGGSSLSTSPPGDNDREHERDGG